MSEVRTVVPNNFEEFTQRFTNATCWICKGFAWMPLGYEIDMTPLAMRCKIELHCTKCGANFKVSFAK